MATAISGSGPGYFYTIVEAFEIAAKKIGMKKNISKELVLLTFLGSAQLMQKTKKESKYLADLIAVKGGTTEAGINILKKNNIQKIIYETLLTAYKKASTLGKN